MAGRVSLSQTLADWREVATRLMLSLDVGRLQIAWLFGLFPITSVHPWQMLKSILLARGIRRIDPPVQERCVFSVISLSLAAIRPSSGRERFRSRANSNSLEMDTSDCDLT